MKAYKLTDSDSFTRNITKWGENVSHTATGKEQYLCSDSWIHFYTDPYIAVFMNPGHADFKNPILWECETDGEHLHEALKSGCKTLTTIKQIPLPEVTLTQKIAFAILCVKKLYTNVEWNKWADKWLSGEDRTSISAKTACVTAKAAAKAAANDTTNAVSAVSAAKAAGYATGYAGHVAETADVAYDDDAGCAAYASVAADPNIDFMKIVTRALTYK